MVGGCCCCLLITQIRLITPERAKELEAVKEAVPPIRPEDRPMSTSSGVSAAADADASS